MSRESMEFDVVIVGAGPAGLSTAIRLRQLAMAAGRDVSVCVIEKGSEVGAHILSGAIIEPRALDTLIPDWRQRGAPVRVPVVCDQFLFLTARRAVTLPTPPPMNNHGNFVISLGNFCRWLATEAQSLGVEIFPGFAAAAVLIDAEGKVCGVTTGDKGVGRNGQPKSNHEPGMDLIAKQIVLAEGCRGSLSGQVMDRFGLRSDCDPETYGLGLKELWEVESGKHRVGTVLHTVGWPLATDTYGGSFLYHMEDNQVAVGFVVGLDYRNPYLSPFDEFQRFKTHPAIRPLFEGGRRIAFGARALSEGGFQSIPKLSFPGGVLVGDAAGFLNVPRIKGIHAAMQSGMIAAEALFDSVGETVSYDSRIRESWVVRELMAIRNIRPAFRFGLWPGLAYAALETYVLRGRAPWTLHHHADHEGLRSAAMCDAIVIPKPDGKVTFDRASSVFLSGISYDDDQPLHLWLKNRDVNLARYDSPEQRYCPAGVYEIVRDGSGPRLVINAANCIHCKACDIKDPTRNITWTVPEGGSGPNYPNM